MHTAEAVKFLRGGLKKFKRYNSGENLGLDEHFLMNASVGAACRVLGLDETTYDAMLDLLLIYEIHKGRMEETHEVFRKNKPKNFSPTFLAFLPVELMILIMVFLLNLKERRAIATQQNLPWAKGGRGFTFFNAYKTYKDVPDPIIKETENSANSKKGPG